MLQDELFDTTEALPLFANAAVQSTHTSRPAPSPIRLQTAWCCSICGGAGPFLTTPTGQAICYPCARIANERR